MAAKKMNSEVVSSQDKSGFDFEEHRREAEQQYQPIRPLYDAFAKVVQAILQDSLVSRRIAVASIQSRAKEVESFGRKAAEPSANNAEQPKYPEPLKQVTDLAGVRVITFFPRTVQEVKQVIEQQFRVIEYSDKADVLLQEDRLGYQSIHFLVSLNPQRIVLPEYARYGGLLAEIQVRTILQHAWAEIEHDIQYKSVETIPASIRRRFMALAGLLEIADREFQAVQDEDEKIRQEARRSITLGELSHVEITADALKAYLDTKLGPDGRMARWTYEWTAKLLRRFGFTNFQQVDQCIAPYNDDELSRLMYGARLGQLSRFQLLLQAGMGRNFIEKHPWPQIDPSWLDIFGKALDRFKEFGINVGSYSPPEVPQQFKESEWLGRE